MLEASRWACCSFTRKVFIHDCHVHFRLSAKDCINSINNFTAVPLPLERAQAARHLALLRADQEAAKVDSKPQRAEKGFVRYRTAVSE